MKEPIRNSGKKNSHLINKNLLYSTGNSTQYSAMTYIRKELKKKSGYLCTTDSLCCMLEMNTTL